MSSSYQETCTEISIKGNILSATCKKRDGSLNKTSIVLKGIENIDGQLKIIDPNKPSNFQKTCTKISVKGNVLSATCKRGDGSLNKTSIVLEGIENIDGILTYTGFSIVEQPNQSETSTVPDPSRSASASPNVAPSPSTVSPEQFIPIEEPEGLNEPATASPNVAPSPLQPSVESSPPVTPTPAIAQPIPPVALQDRQMVLVLNENHQGISAGSGALRPQGRFTIEAWVYPTSDAGKQVIYSEGGTLFYLEGGELKFQTPLSTQAIASGQAIHPKRWYHVAVARGGRRPGYTKLYINGVRNDNQMAIFPVASFGNTYLGGEPDVPESRFQGKLLEVRVWRYARSQDEIQANMTYFLTGRELGLVRYWRMNEGFGTAIGDTTTNRAGGTVYGDAIWEESEIPIKIALNAQERLTRSTGLEDYGYWYQEMAKQQKTEADPPFRRGRIWA